MGNRDVGSNPTLSAIIISTNSRQILVVLDGEVAVPCSLQPAVAGSNAYIEALFCQGWPRQVVLTIGSCAT